MQRVNEDFGMIFWDFDFEPMWKRWQPADEHQQERHQFVPRPPDGWSLTGQRCLPLDPLHAQAMNGWIRVEKKEDDK